jgi:hypothetical protein
MFFKISLIAEKMNLLLVQSLVLIMLLLYLVVTNNLSVSFALVSQFSPPGQIISATTISHSNGNRTTYTLLIDYKRSGGIAADLHSSNNLNISFNSDTKKMIVNGQEVRQLQPLDEIKLSRIIIDNGLHNARYSYPPRTGSADYQTYILNATVDHEKPKLVIWTDTSPDVPKGIWNISSTIQDLASK